MNNAARSALPLLLFLLLPLRSTAQLPSPHEDLNMAPDQVTTLLKDQWTFLREQTDGFLKQIEKRGEFETSPEFAARVQRERDAYVGRVNAHIKEFKLDKRLFGVLLKATLTSYNADAGTYTVDCPVTVIIPYDTPTLVCQIPSNEYVGLTDTIQGGYRTSKLHLKFAPSFSWKVSRSVASTAKANEGEIYFKVRFRLDIDQRDFKEKARIRIIPQDILLVDQAKRLLYWRQQLQ